MQQSVHIRPLIGADASVFASAFAEMGWHKPVSLFERYLSEHGAGERDSFVALLGAEVAGYVTVLWRPHYPPLAARAIPEIQDLNVLPPFRRQGIASRLMDQAEQLVSLRAPEVGIGVGLHPGYRAAQRLYVLRGYVPDANGVTYRDKFIVEGESVVADDDLVLHFTKGLKASR